MDLDRDLVCFQGGPGDRCVVCSECIGIHPCFAYRPPSVWCTLPSESFLNCLVNKAATTAATVGLGSEPARNLSLPSCYISGSRQSGVSGNIWKHPLREECVEAEGAQIPKTACVLHGFLWTFPLGNQDRLQRLSFPFPQFLSWVTASLKAHHSSAPDLSGPLGSIGIE